MENTAVLIVEDEVISAKMLKAQLKKAGYNTLYHVTTGEKAIISAKENQPQIIIMDIRLAGEIDGIEAATEIKQSENPHIIFLTGYEDTETKAKAQTLDPLGYMIKPVNIRELKKIMEDNSAVPMKPIDRFTP